MNKKWFIPKLTVITRGDARQTVMMGCKTNTAVGMTPYRPVDSVVGCIVMTQPLLGPTPPPGGCACEPLRPMPSVPVGCAMVVDS